MRLVKRCVDCGKELGIKNKHHFRCKTCWYEYMGDASKHSISTKINKRIGPLKDKK